MNWLLDHLQFVIIIAFAFASWLKHRADVKNAEREERRAREEMADDETIFGPAENWQQPASAAEPSVPPPLTRPVTPPPLRVSVTEVDALLKRQQEMQDRLRQIKEAKATTSGDAAATQARTLAVGKPAKPFMPGNTSLRADLRDSRKTRRAIILREILSPPLGLR